MTKVKLLHWPKEGTEETVAILETALRTPGGVVLVPTETIYGLVARAADEAACRRVCALKKRPPEKHNGWFVGDWQILPEFGVNIDGLPAQLAAKFCPGALTIIAPENGGGSRGFRVPDHPLLSELLKRFDEPLMQTSANGSGMADALSVAGALAQLEGEPDVVVDAGALPPGSCGSTVVDATGGELKILREGKISAADLNKGV